MSAHNFDELVAQYPGVIAQMSAEFTAHQFILRLAQHHQRLYVEALYAYKNSPSQGAATPFKIVHGQLAQRLGGFPHLVRYKDAVKSRDIFGCDNGSSQWEKV